MICSVFRSVRQDSLWLPGIFDSVGSFYWPGNDDEGFINGNLAEGSADFVYHPVASDEIRRNFPLTSIAPGLSAAVEETSWL